MTLNHDRNYLTGRDLAPAPAIGPAILLGCALTGASIAALAIIILFISAS